MCRSFFVGDDEGWMDNKGWTTEDEMMKGVVDEGEMIKGVVNEGSRN